MMNNFQSRDSFDKPAKIISVIFHPLFIPVYGMAIIFSAPTLLEYLPATLKKLLFLIVLINNVFLPLSILPFFRYRNVISSWAVEDRKERNIPLLITTLLYFVTSFIIMKLQVPVFLKSFLIALFFISLAITVINFWWKISIHSTGAGTLVALVFILSYKMYTSLEWYLIPVIIMGGLVLSSRLKLNYHNPPQVWVGFLTGFLGLSLFMGVF
jgi:hypothetical protein